MDEFEQRLRATLDEHAGSPDPRLDGPGLRRLAAERHRPGARLRRAGPVLATAAAVAAIGIVAAVFTHPGDPEPPVQPGGVPPGRSSSAVPSAPSEPTPPATTGPTQRPVTPNATPTAPGRPSRPLVSVPANGSSGGSESTGRSMPSTSPVLPSRSESQRTRDRRSVTTPSSVVRTDGRGRSTVAGSR